MDFTIDFLCINYSGRSICKNLRNYLGYLTHSYSPIQMTKYRNQLLNKQEYSPDQSVR